MEAAIFLGLIRRRWLALLACVLAGLAGAYAVTSATPSAYEASTRLFVNFPASRGVSEALQGVQLTRQLLESYGRIATSHVAAQRIVEKLNLPLSEGPLRARLRATPERDTLIIRISATDRNPARARAIADAAAAVFVDIIGELEVGRAEAIQARVIDPAALPTVPVSPRPGANLATGGALGILAGLGLAVALDAMDRTVKTPSQTAEAFRAPLLGVLPRRREADDRPLIMVDEVGNREGEAYRALRTAVRFIESACPLRTILLTSASVSEGKTTTAANLAIAFAQSGERVVLVDADLRRTQLAQLFRLDSRVGLTSVVREGICLVDAVQGWRTHLGVLTTGPLPPNPSEVLGSQRMVDAVEALRRMADVVIFDAPPVLPVTDAELLAAQVDGVVLIARAGRTHRGAAAEARRRLDVVGANVVGCVLNAVRNGASADYYADYGYYADPSTRQLGRGNADDGRATRPPFEQERAARERPSR